MSVSRKPALIVPPSEFLQEELEARDWRIVDLAREMNCAEHYVRSLVRGGHRITRMAAMLLEGALGSSAQYWLNLQEQYDDYLRRTSGESPSHDSC